jgi:nucleoside-diphosphate-sugar epimerase
VRVLVTGARGKVGSHAVAALQAAGHDVTATDLARPTFERDPEGAPAYVQADLTDAGEAFAVVRDHDAVVHSAAIPDPLHNAPHVVLHTNLTSSFNVVEACVRLGVPRLVNISSETVPGVVFGEGRVMPPYLPIDEATPRRAQDEYGFAKETIERWCDRVALRHGLSTITIRPSWVMHPGNYERNLGPMVRDPFTESLNFWSYTDARDIAEAIRLACEVEHSGHTVLYVAQPDTANGRPLAELVERVYPEAGIELRDLPRPDASGLDCTAARELLGWEPRWSWRDVLDEQGRTLPGTDG